MLSRIANNLYWTGRYLERMEHVARFVPVTYFSTLDGPDVISLDYALNTINKMAGSLNLTTLTEKEVLHNVAFERTNPSSILSCIITARENCRGSRDILSTELWESINSLYHFVMNYNNEKYSTTGMQDFMVNIQHKVALCKSRVHTTLIQNQVWSALELGLLVERSIQINRIVAIKSSQLRTFNSQVEGSYEINNMLKCIESYDMNRKFYKKAPELKTAIEFLYLNNKFPRSIMYVVNEICTHLSQLGIDQKVKSKSVKIIAKSLKNDLLYTNVEEFLENLEPNILEIEEKLFRINNVLVNHYFVN